MRFSAKIERKKFLLNFIIYYKISWFFDFVFFSSCLGIMKEKMFTKKEMNIFFNYVHNILYVFAYLFLCIRITIKNKKK